jgi:recombination protein RecA
MPSASALRQQIESKLAQRIPSALTPLPHVLRPVVSTGIEAVDELLCGGLPLGAVTEIVGPECSGRTTLGLSFLSQITAKGRVCAWIDVADSLHPESAAAAGIDLMRLLWVRCGAQGRTEAPSPGSKFVLPEKYLIPPPIKKGLHGGGFGPHPRGEVKGLSDAVSGLLCMNGRTPGRVELQHQDSRECATIQHGKLTIKEPTPRHLNRIDQALRVTDLLLQAGGFSAIVLDMGSIAPELASRVPLATWFRYRAAAERTQASILILTQHACAKSSAALVLQMQPSESVQEVRTLFTESKHWLEVIRERFAPAHSNVIPMRKPPQSIRQVSWPSQMAWAGRQ